LTLLTRKRGKLVVKAKGSKKLTSKRMGILQTGNLIKGKIFPSRGFLVLGETELLYQPLEARKSLVRCGSLLSMCELTNRLLPENQPEREVYALFWETLLRLEKEFQVETMINFEVKLLKILGYGVPKEALIPLKKKNWKLAQAEIWRYLNDISEGELIGLGKLLV